MILYETWLYIFGLFDVRSHLDPQTDHKSHTSSTQTRSETPNWTVPPQRRVLVFHLHPLTDGTQHLARPNRTVIELMEIRVRDFLPLEMLSFLMASMNSSFSFVELVSSNLICRSHFLQQPDQKVQIERLRVARVDPHIRFRWELDHELSIRALQLLCLHIRRVTHCMMASSAPMVPPPSPA